jgi:hypothetical protein
MIDSVGDIIVAISASIAAGSGISAWRLLRRLHNLEQRFEGSVLETARLRAMSQDLHRQGQDQAIFNQVIEERLEELERKPAPKQEKKMGTPRPQNARGLLYGRTRQGPQVNR